MPQEVQLSIRRSCGPGDMAVLAIQLVSPEFTCSQCGVACASRNLLFKHLRTCLPQVNLCLGSRNNGLKVVRVALTLGYVGLTYYGAQLNAPDVERTRPSVAGAIHDALQRAWGEVVSTTFRFAVRTEKAASAMHNVLVLHIKRGSQCTLDEIALRRELPRGLAMHGPPRVVPKVGEDVWHAVKRQTHVAMVPYAAFFKHAAPAIGQIAERGDGRGGQGDGCSVWLSGLCDDCTESDLRALIAESVKGRCDDMCVEVMLPACGGFAEIACQSAETCAHTVQVLDGQYWRGRRLTALALDEAKAKIRIHQQIKAVLRTLQTTKNFRNFVEAKGTASAASGSRRLLHCSSSVQSDFRPRRGTRPSGEWLSTDWVEIEFSAKEFGAQQLRRMAGVIIAVVRGIEGSDYVERCISANQQVATPLAPAEAFFLAAFALSNEKVAEAYLGADAVSSVVVDEREGRVGCAQMTDKKRLEEEQELFASRLREAVVVAAEGPYAEFIGGLDRGDATRSSDDAKLRAAAASGNLAALEDCIKKGIGRCSATDEYGRSPLFLAAFAGHADAVDLLLAHGAPSAQAAHGGWTPTSAARAMHHDAVVQLLEAASDGPMTTIAPVLRSYLDQYSAAVVHMPSATVTPLIPQTLDHPGAGSMVIDDFLPQSSIDALLHLWRTLPMAAKDKPSPIDRFYYSDVDGWLCRAIDAALADLGILSPRYCGPRPHQWHTQPLLRFLHYPEAGGSLPAHVDLPRTASTGVKTTHTLILYLTDCEHGGETLLLESRPGDEKLAYAGGVAHGERAIFARSAPKRGRLLLMPHTCPHSAAPVVSAPKLLIRGEIVLNLAAQS